jgi:hypothetical protein
MAAIWTSDPDVDLPTVFRHRYNVIFPAIYTFQCSCAMQILGFLLWSCGREIGLGYHNRGRSSRGVTWAQHACTARLLLQSQGLSFLDIIYTIFLENHGKEVGKREEIDAQSREE